MSEYVRITDRKIELTDEGVKALMTQYTPTTEEVRDAYESTWLSDTMTGRDAEFNRWLVAERKRVAELAIQRERERVVKLLNEHHYAHPAARIHVTCNICTVLKLIDEQS